MKLKLEQQDYGTILTVTESIEHEQVAVIKAGLGKILLNDSRPVLVDLCGIPDSQLNVERLTAELVALKAWAACQDRELFVAAAVRELGDAATREQGAALLASARAREAALEAACRIHVEKLERQKNALEKKRASLEGAGSRLRKLRKENSDLRKRIALAETQIRSLPASRGETGRFEENASRLRTAERTLRAVLEKQGFLEAQT